MSSSHNAEAADELRSSQFLRALAWAVFGLTMLGDLVDVGFGVANHNLADAGDGLVFAAFPIVGVLLASRRPRNPLGWLMLAIGLSFSMPASSYARYALETHPGALPGPEIVLAIVAPMWVPFIGCSAFLLLLFPDGHLPSPRWRWFARVCAVGLILLFLAVLLAPGGQEDAGFPQVENAFGLEALRPLLGLVYVPVVFAPLAVVGGAIALITRMRRTTDPTERQQLRWLVWAAGVIATIYVLAFLPAIVLGTDQGAWSNWLGTIAACSFILIPVTIGIAVLRYRLYDIDFVIRKTVVFAVMVGVIAAVYVALVVGVGALIGSRGNPALSALAAAVVALVFQPVRVRARRLADRVVYGKRATPYEVLAEFGDQLAGTYAADDVLARLASVLGEGVGAERARVWLRVGGDDLRPVATWPTDADPDPPDDATVEVRHRGEPLGALSVAMPVNDPMDPAREKLVADLAAQAGLVLRNVRLTEELRARLDDLAAAQKRLVTAQDEERRRLERNIHDGAQQQLVALAVKLRLAQSLVERDPPRAAALLDELQGETGQALQDLRDLARGIYPPLLVDEGLAAALTAQARRSPVPVTVDADGIDRLPQEIEAALYFASLEALQNVGKYAHASSGTVSVRREGGSIVAEIVDDGRGFDTATTGHGSGLRGLADRVGALGGTVDVWSAPGAGTRITCRVPMPSGDIVPGVDR